MVIIKTLTILLSLPFIAVFVLIRLAQAMISTLRKPKPIEFNELFGVDFPHHLFGDNINNTVPIPETARHSSEGKIPQAVQELFDKVAEMTEESDIPLRTIYTNDPPTKIAVGWDENLNMYFADYTNAVDGIPEWKPIGTG